MTLATATIGQAVRISSVKLEDDVVAWLHAVGLSEGELVTVLRHAAFGGPLHVRTASGGEFAIAREIAVKLAVETAEAATTK